MPGVPGEREGGLTDYLLKDGKTNTSSVVKKGTKGAKEARLYYHVLKEKEDRFLVEIQLFTGRHHQIRVQMANAGMPLLGDAKYGRSEGREPLALCAARLSFCHPSTKEQLSFSCTPKGTAFKEFYE